MAEFSVSQHFENKDPVVKSIYERILQESRKFGKVISRAQENFHSSGKQVCVCRCNDAKERSASQHQICSADQTRPDRKERTTFCQTLSPGSEADLTR